MATSWTSFQKPSWISRAFSVLLGSLLWILATPTLLLFFLPCLLLRLTVHTLATLFRPELTPLWALGDGILALAPTSARWNMNTAQIWRVEGLLEAEEFRSHFHARFLSSPQRRGKYGNLAKRIVSWGGYTFKKEVGIDLRQLIRSRREAEEVLGLGEDFKDDPSDLRSDLDKWMAPIAAWMARNDYAEDGPAWGGLILQRKVRNETLILVKMDHALTDGYSWAHLVSTLCERKAPYLVVEKPLPLHRRLEIFLSFPKHGVEQLWGYWRAGPLPYPASDKPSNTTDKPGHEWRLSFTRLDLERVKTCRRLGGGVHFSSVLGAVVVGALKEYLSQVKGQKIRLPDKIYLPSPVGWPNHPAMSDKPTDSCVMVNHMSVRNVCYPCGVTFDPVQCLKEGEADLNRSEAWGQAEGFHGIIASLAWTLPSFLLAKILAWTGRGRVLEGGMGQVLTPLVLSPEEHLLLGKKVLELKLPVCVPHLLVATKVYVVPVSVGGALEVSVSGRSDAFPEQEDINRFTKECLPKELDRVYEALIKIRGRDQ